MIGFAIKIENKLSTYPTAACDLVFCLFSAAQRLLSSLCVKNNPNVD